MPEGDTFTSSILIEAKEDAPRLEEGRRLFAFPPSTKTIYNDVPLWCERCSKKTLHNPATKVYVKPLHDTIKSLAEDKYRLLSLDILYLQNALARLARICYGMPIDIVYNANGLPVNIYQQESYEIIETSLSEGSALASNQIRLRGANPNRLGSTFSAENPEWIGNGGIELNRLINSGLYYHLPIGALARFLFPSVLTEKSEPLLEKVSEITSVENGLYTFVANFNQSVSCALTPIDLIYGDAPRVWLTFHYYQFFPEDWLDCPLDNSIGWTKVQETLTNDDLIDGIYTIAKQVLFPSDIETNLTLFGCTVDNQYVEFGSLDVQTIQDGDVYTTTFDFSAYPELESIQLMYFANAGESDYVWFRTRAICVHSRYDRSGSYIHGTANYCDRYVGEDGTIDEGMVEPFSRYKDICWQPNCPNFSLDPSIRGGQYKCALGEWLRNLWSAADLVLRQIIPGYSSTANFSIERRNVPSLHQMAGLFVEKIPRTISQGFQELFHHAICGQYITYNGTEYPVDERQTLRYGAFWGRDSLYDGDYEFDMENMGNVAEGLFPALVDGYTDRITAEGTAVDNTNDPNFAVRYYPHRNAGDVNLADYSVGGDGLKNTQMAQADCFSVVVAYSPDDPIVPPYDDFIDNIRGVYSG